MVFFRSIIFQVYFFASVCFFSLSIAIFAWLPYTVRFSFARTWGRSMLWVGRWLCGLRYQFEGLENIPDEPGVVLIKHSTVFETYAQLVVFPAHAWVLNLRMANDLTMVHQEVLPTDYQFDYLQQSIVGLGEFHYSLRVIGTG